MTQQILVVDDSRTVRTVVEWVFHGSPYHVVTAATASEAVRAIRQHVPAVVLVDYSLPDQSGYELCQELRRDPSTSAVKLIMLGGTWGGFDEAKVPLCGADDFIYKPFKTDDLIEKVAAVLTRGQRTVQLTPDEPADAVPSALPSLPPEPELAEPGGFRRVASADRFGEDERAELEVGPPPLPSFGGVAPEMTPLPAGEPEIAAGAPFDGDASYEPDTAYDDARSYDDAEELELDDDAELEAIEDDDMFVDDEDADEAPEAREALEDDGFGDEFDPGDATDPGALSDEDDEDGPASAADSEDDDDRAEDSSRDAFERGDSDSDESESRRGDSSSSDSDSGEIAAVAKTSRPVPAVAGLPPEDDEEAPAPAPAYAAPTPPPSPVVAAPAPVEIDDERLRAIVREALPPIVKEVLAALLRDSIGARVEAYATGKITAFVEQELPAIAEKAIAAKLDAE